MASFATKTLSLVSLLGASLQVTGLLASLLFVAGPANADVAESSPLPQSLSSLPQTIERALNTFNTPGIAVGILHEGKTAYLAGHGLRDVTSNAPVTPETYFYLASVSKAFTAASLGILVQDNKLSWDDKVIDHLPAFQLADPWVTREFTIRDMLTHRSGLASGAGDSMLWPAPSRFSRDEVIYNLRFLSPQTSFRSQFAYSNVMYIAASAVADNLYDGEWAELVEQRLFQPLAMSCFAAGLPERATDNVANGYGYSEDRGLYAIHRNDVSEDSRVWSAAGAITCNAHDMLKWLSMWLARGRTPDGQTLFEESTVDAMLSAVTPLSVSSVDQQWFNTEYSGYALGWRVTDQFSHNVISHTGTISGFQTFVAFVPAKNLGIVLLNNGSDYGTRGAIMQTILQAYLEPGTEQRDWIAAYADFQKDRQARFLASYQKPHGSGTVLLATSEYLGQFTDRWFGGMTVFKENDRVRIRSEKMPTLTGTLTPFEDHTFVIRWDNEDAMEDAFIHFSVSTQRRVTGFTLYPYTLKEKSNHAYRDMRFTRSEKIKIND
ncbi:serine hydrolase [Alteromonas sp. H39]|uniref:serine hydrolase n=1 Tax=Alteromonas sp. H39 TaxID=3389876 RepID=UPI0039E00334